MSWYQDVTCLDELEMSGNITAVSELSGKNLVSEKLFITYFLLGLQQCSVD